MPGHCVVFLVKTLCYYIAGSASGQDEANRGHIITQLLTKLVWSITHITRSASLYPGV